MKVSNEVIDILEQGRIDGDKFYLPEGQLDRRLYMAVNKALECLGGKWDRKSKSHVFSAEIGDVIDNVVLTGEVCNLKKELQYFPTPPEVVDRMLKLARLSEVVEYLLLEPSAGTGAIASKLGHYGVVECCEINTKFHSDLHALGCDIVGFNFLEFDPEYHYDAIIANPPFTRQQDIDHVNHMMDLCPDGTIVSVMSAGVLFRNDRKTTAFRARVDERGGEFMELPEGSFKQSGTMVNTCVLVIRN